MKATDHLFGARKIMYAYNKLCEPLLEKYDIPQVSFDILMFLNNNSQYCTAREISEIRNIKKNLVSVHVEKLCQCGLIERSEISGDRRKVCLSLTEKSSDIIREGKEVQRRFFVSLTKDIGHDELEIFNSVLKKTVLNAENMIEDANKK